MKTFVSLLLAVIPVMVHAQATQQKDLGKADTLTFTRDASVLWEQHRLGKEVRDFQKAFPAMKIDPRTMTAVTTAANYRIDGQPLLWFSADKTRAVLNEHYFSDLTVVNVTRLSEGDKITQGRLKEPGRKLEPRALAWFLMQIGVILTFIHMEATVHLDGEKPQDSRYEAVFSGNHVYYTNRRYDSAYRFRFILEKDGTIRIEP